MGKAPSQAETLNMLSLRMGKQTAAEYSGMPEKSPQKPAFQLQI
ncbi:hypothetical protein [Hoeflea sp.]|nr:hypothetical protein [Hoeflea sp.]